MRHLPRLALSLRIALVAAVTLAGAALAQEGTGIGLDVLRQDPTLPIEIVSDKLTVDQARGTATFTGNVVVVQGALRLGAGTLLVEYDPDGTGIRRMTASGGVTFATETDAAEAQEAVYDVTAGTLALAGGVVLTQGPATIMGDRLKADLRAGTGRIEGRVRTLFRPAAPLAP